MASLVKRQHWRAAIGLIAAYAIALQALFAAFSPLAQAGIGPDHLVICLNSGELPSAGDPLSPSAPAGHQLHCVLCGSVLAGAAILPPAVAAPEPLAQPAGLNLPASETRIALVPVRAGLSRAPPLNV